MPPSSPSASEFQLRVYQELKQIARMLFRGQPKNHTLQPTALVHEAWVRLIGEQRLDPSSRLRFLSVAATAMRNLLVDHARKRKSKRRGGDHQRTRLEEVVAATEDRIDLLTLDESLQELANLNSRMGRVVELRFFGGLTIQETAEVLEVGTTTVENDWAAAKVWLTRSMGRGLSDD